MTPVAIMAIGAVVVAAIFVLPQLQKRMADEQLRGECSAIASDLRLSRTQGGSVDEQQRLEASLADCRIRMGGAGLPTDEYLDHITSIRTTRNQMQQEFTHLKSTDYADILKRGNTYGTILRLGEDLAPRYRAAVESLSEDESKTAKLRELAREVAIDIGAARARRSCYGNEGSGCGRYFGSVEQDPRSKARGEDERVIEPLIMVRSELREAIDVDAAGDEDLATAIEAERVESITAAGGAVARSGGVRA